MSKISTTKTPTNSRWICLNSGELALFHPAGLNTGCGSVYARTASGMARIRLRAGAISYRQYAPESPYFAR